MSQADDFESLLAKYPKLRSRFAEILSIANNSSGELIRADDAEDQVVASVRQLGREVLEDWARHIEEEGQASSDANGQLRRDKKKLRWYSCFGPVDVQEQRYRLKGNGKRYRPLCETAGVGHRQYSRRLQRIISDFGADHAFAQVNGKLQEHYGISVVIEKARQITEQHGEQAKAYLTGRVERVKAKARIVSETDGSMIPIRHYDPTQAIEKAGNNGECRHDARKHKTLGYREYRLSLAHEAGTRTLKFAGTLGRVDASGRAMRESVERVGLDANSAVHAVGDGAPWIAEQVEKQFGAQGHYLVDLYHVCDYLVSAARVCQPADQRAWVKRQKARLKRNDWQQVLCDLLPFIESPDQPDEQAPVRCCYRYLRNRRHQLDYQGAQEAGLPLGSGEIESAHRYIVQNRMKIAGAWWLEANAESLLALRICRANGLWGDYWKQLA